MIEIRTLGSGSAGNASVVRYGSTTLLVDAGLSAKQLVGRLALCGVEPRDISGILLTHEHSDHTSSLKVLLSKHDLPVYCNALTARALQDGGLQYRNWRLFQNGADFSIGDFSVRAFSVPHDASDPVGFRLAANGSSLGVLTDLGYATRLCFEALKGIGALLIETNHDESLLQKCTRRPWPVKQRILSRHGHLSNVAAAGVIAELDAREMQLVVLGHLSRDCNTPQLALDAIGQCLTTAGRAGTTRVHCAEQDQPSPTFSII